MQTDIDCAATERTIYVDLRVFSMNAVKKTVYRFCSKYSADIVSEGPTRLRVTFTPRDGSEPADRNVEADFKSELLDQDLRERIYAETEPVRRLLLAHALSRVPLIDPELEQADYAQDPSVEH